MDNTGKGARHEPGRKGQRMEFDLLVRNSAAWESARGILVPSIEQISHHYQTQTLTRPSTRAAAATSGQGSCPPRKKEAWQRWRRPHSLPGWKRCRGHDSARHRTLSTLTYRGVRAVDHPDSWKSRATLPTVSSRRRRAKPTCVERWEREAGCLSFWALCFLSLSLIWGGNDRSR